LKQILESSTVTKYFFDVRNDSDALFSLYSITLAGVQDIQLMELATRYRAKTMLGSLAKCIEYDSGMSYAEKSTWLATKSAVHALYSPDRGGSYEIFNERPMRPAMVMYCAQDVQCLPKLVEVYARKMSPLWAKKVSEESERRLRESRSVG